MDLFCDGRGAKQLVRRTSTMKSSGILFSSDEWAAMSSVETVQEAVALFETVGMPSRNLSARTRVEYSRDLEELVAFLETHGVRTLGEVSLARLQAYQASLEGTDYSSATRRRKTHSAKSFFRFLHAYGVATQDLGARLIPPPTPHRAPRFLSEEEFGALRRACSQHPRDAALIELFLQTGLRLSEVSLLTVDDLQMPDQISPAADDVGFVQVVRRGGGQEQIPLNFKVCHALKRMLDARPPSVSHRSLFVSRLGRALSKRRIQAAVAKYLSGAGITGASVHTLRHTMATHHIARGTDLSTVQDTLGHADISTTALYVPLAKKAQRQALQEHAL